MVHYSFPALALLAISASPSVAGFPTTSSTTTAATHSFSISQWIEDIIADPNGAHLSPEEAVAAKSAAVEANPLTKKAWCHDWSNASAADAAACLDDLARKGANGVQCVVPGGTGYIQMCQIGKGVIDATKSTRDEVGANCGDVARTGGLIFDSCWRADGTVRGAEICITNHLFQVNIRGCPANVDRC